VSVQQTTNDHTSFDGFEPKGPLTLP